MAQLAWEDTTIPSGEGYEGITLVFVDGNSDNIPAESVTVYYYIGNDWDAGVVVYSALGGFCFDDQDYDNTRSLDIALPETVADEVAADEVVGSRNSNILPYALGGVGVVLLAVVILLIARGKKKAE